MAVVALLLPDASANARLASALDDGHRVLHSPNWRQLRRLVAAHPVDLCVVDLYDPFRSISRQQLQQLRRGHPDLAIVVHGDFEDRAADLFDLGRLRVDGVLQATGREERHTIRRVVEGALARAAAGRVLRALDDNLPPVALDAVAWSVEFAETRPRVGDLATAMGTTASALRRDLRDRGLPPARTILLWGRVLQAARILESPGSTVDNAAFRVGYATGGALRRVLKRYCGLAPRALTQRGGLSVALEAFKRSLGGRRPDQPTARNSVRRRWAGRPNPPLGS